MWPHGEKNINSIRVIASGHQAQVSRYITDETAGNHPNKIAIN